MGTRLTVFNQKGGVGKTTTALARDFWKRKRREKLPYLLMSETTSSKLRGSVVFAGWTVAGGTRVGCIIAGCMMQRSRISQCRYICRSFLSASASSRPWIMRCSTTRPCRVRMRKPNFVVFVVFDDGSMISTGTPCITHHFWGRKSGRHDRYDFRHPSLAEAAQAALLGRLRHPQAGQIPVVNNAVQPHPLPGAQQAHQILDDFAGDDLSGDEHRNTRG